MANKINPEQVPDEVWTQVALRLESAGAVVSDQVAKMVAADALNAWPGMHTHEWQRPWLGGMSGTDLILPLAQKQEDGDA